MNIPNHRKVVPTRRSRYSWSPRRARRCSGATKAIRAMYSAPIATGSIAVGDAGRSARFGQRRRFVKGDAHVSVPTMEAR
jgi:hypothetical protein